MNFAAATAADTAFFSPAGPKPGSGAGFPARPRGLVAFGLRCRRKMGSLKANCKKAGVYGIGGRGGLHPLGGSYLVDVADGVGTKLKLAFETGIHDSIGIDLVAMSVNHIVTYGAKPLFFLDYFSTSHLDVDLAAKVIKGIVDGCQQSDCKLLGGETAEMPDFYAKGEYDLSGYAVGSVNQDSVIDGKNIAVGDILIGLPSSGVHSNGFSLVRRVLAQSGLSLNEQLPGNNGTQKLLGEALMAPTVIYVKKVLDIIGKGGVKGIAHIAGGGLTENIPKVFPLGLVPRSSQIHGKSLQCSNGFKRREGLKKLR